MSVYAIDFETFYSKEFSVTDLGYYHYVNHTEFDAYMVSIVGDDGNEFVGNPRDFDWDCLAGHTWVSHNTSFDGIVHQRLVEQGVISAAKPSEWLDTADLVAYMGLPRSLKAACAALFDIKVEKSTRDNMAGKKWDQMIPEFKKEVEEYALKDSRLCLRIWKEYNHIWPKHEQKLSTHTREMGWRGMPVDTDGVDEDIRLLELKLWEARKQIPWADDEDAKVLSPKAMAEECRKHGIEPPRSMAQDSDEFDKWKEKYSDKFPFAQAMSDYRRINALLLKFKTLKQRTKPDGRMAYGLKYFGAHTGRWSGDSGFNAQNMPRGELFGVNLRKRIKAPEGKTLVICDLSNIEPRCLALLCEDHATLRSLRSGMDIYEAHARATMGYDDPRPLKDGNPFLRQVAKTRVLGLGYGCGWHKFVGFAGQLLPADVYESVFGQEVSSSDMAKFATALGKRRKAELVEEFKALDDNTKRYWVNAWKQVEQYRKDNEKITSFWKQLEDDARRAKLRGIYQIVLPSDRTLTYRKIMDHGGISAEVLRLGKLMRMSIHGGILTENVTQALARDVFADCLLRLDEAGIEVILHAHDEAVCLVDSDKVEEKTKEIVKIMSTPPTWMPGLPQAAEGKSSERYTK
mgnify:CR=1 FL=1